MPKQPTSVESYGEQRKQTLDRNKLTTSVSFSGVVMMFPINQRLADGGIPQVYRKGRHAADAKQHSRMDSHAGHIAMNLFLWYYGLFTRADCWGRSLVVENFSVHPNEISC